MRQKTLPWTSTVPSLILGLLLGLFAASATATAQSIDFTTNPADEGALGVGYLYNADAVSSDDSEVRYSLRFGPKGMRVDPATGIVRWSPSGLGTVDIEIRAELVDDPSIAGTQSWSVQVGLLDEHPGCVESSTWLTPGGGLPGGSMFAQEVDGKFAVLHETETRTDATHALSIWSNGSWSELNAFNVPFLDTAEIFGMAYFRGDYYLAGSQLTASDPSGSNGGVSRIGDGLEEVGSSNLFHGLAVVTHDDALYVAGYENSDWRELVVKRFDGTSWTSVGTWEQPLRRRANFAVLGGELYLASSDRLSRIEKTSVSEQTVWTEANGVKIVEYDGGLARFASGQDLFVWRPDGGSTTLPSLDFDPNNDADIFEHDGTLYAVEAKRTGGRLDFRRSYEVWYLAGDVWLPVSSLEGPISRINQEFASFAGSLFLLGSLDASCDAPIGNIARLCREGQGDCGRVSGSVYLDANRNCDIDQGEGLERNQTITFEPGGYVARTDETGEFGVLLPVGNYRAGLVPKRHWIATCNDPVAVDITNVATSVTGIAFSTDMIPGIRDMSISVANSPIRTGRPVVYALRYENVGTLPATGTASFTHAPDFTIEEITQEPDRTNGNRLEWDFEDLPVGESVTIKIEMTAPMTIERDDVVCVATDVTFDKVDIHSWTWPEAAYDAVVAIFAGGVSDEHAPREPDLRRGEADAGGLVHENDHASGDGTDLVRNLGDGFSDLPQHGVGVVDDASR